MSVMSAAVDKLYEQVKQLSEAEREEFVERMAKDGAGLRAVKAEDDPLAERDAAERAELNEEIEASYAEYEAGQYEDARAVIARL